MTYNRIQMKTVPKKRVSFCEPVFFFIFSFKRLHFGPKFMKIWWNRHEEDPNRIGSDRMRDFTLKIIMATVCHAWIWPFSMFISVNEPTGQHNHYYLLTTYWNIIYLIWSIANKIKIWNCMLVEEEEKSLLFESFGIDPSKQKKIMPKKYFCS